MLNTIQYNRACWKKENTYKIENIENSVAINAYLQVQYFSSWGSFTSKRGEITYTSQDGSKD